MKLSEFSRQSKFVPKTLGNDKLPEAEQFYLTINTLNNTDTFELNAVMLKSQQLMEEAKLLPRVEYEKPDQPGVKYERDSTAATLLKQQAALEVINGFGKIAIKYCELHNLKGADDQPVSIQDMANYPALSETIVEIMTHMLGLSQVSEDDEKN